MEFVIDFMAECRDLLLVNSCYIQVVMYAVCQFCKSGADLFLFAVQDVDKVVLQCLGESKACLSA